MDRSARRARVPLIPGRTASRHWQPGLTLAHLAAKCHRRGRRREADGIAAGDLGPPVFAPLSKTAGMGTIIVYSVPVV